MSAAGTRMHQFDLLVVGRDGIPKRVAFTAASLEAAKEMVCKQGLTLLSGIAAPPHPASTTKNIFQTKAGIDVILLCSQLRLLLQAGLNVNEALDALLEDVKGEQERSTIQTLKQRLQHGNTLSAAMATEGLGIPRLLVSMVRASEKTANLPSALARYVEYASQVDLLKRKARTALIYPAFILALGGLVTLFLLFFVVPRFASIYDSIRTPLPFMATVMLYWGKWVRENSTMAMVGFLAIILFALAFALLPKIRLLVWRQFERIGIISRSVEQIFLARLYRTLAMLLESGIPLSQALSEARGLDAQRFDARLNQCITSISHGNPLVAALGDAGLLTGVARHLLSAGQHSGNVEVMLGESAGFLEAQTAQLIDRAMRLLEPALMAIVGIIIGAIVMMMYLPIFELAGSLQ